MNDTSHIDSDISCIIPAYNISEYISEALASALRQQPPFREIIVVDDGSTDSTRDVVYKFADKRILYYYQNNQGLGPARNTGIKLASSKYMYFMDGDDIIDHNLTKYICSTIEKHGKDIDVILFSGTAFGGKPSIIKAYDKYYTRRVTGIYSTGEKALLASLRHHNFPVSTCLYVFRRSTLDTPRSLRFLNIIHEDEVFTPSLLMGCGVTVVSNRVLYHRRLRPGSIVSQPGSIKNVLGHLTASQLWCDLSAGARNEGEGIFLRQAYESYALAIQYAARSDLKCKTTRKAVQHICPHFMSFINFDIALSKLSRKLALYFIRLRSQIQYVIKIKSLSSLKDR